MTEHDRRLMDEWQSSCEGVTERRLKDMLNAIDDLNSLKHRRQGMHTLRASMKDIKSALRSLHDLYLEVGEHEPPSALVVRLSELREVYAASR